MSNIIKSTQVIIDSKKYFLKEKFLVSEYNGNDNNDEKSKTENKNSIEDFIKAKEDILEEAKVEHDKIIELALNEKEEIINQGFEDAEEIKKKAKQEGYDKGYENAVESMNEHKENVIKEMNIKKEEMLGKYKEYFVNREEQMISLIINSVEKILNKELSDDKFEIINLVKKGIDESIMPKEIIIKVSQSDYDVAVTKSKDILAYSQNIENVEFKIDDSLIKGDCLIESKNGELDVGIRTQFNKLKEIYLSLVNE